jgi:hypothetical protein
VVAGAVDLGGLSESFFGGHEGLNRAWMVSAILGRSDNSYEAQRREDTKKTMVADRCGVGLISSTASNRF